MFDSIINEAQKKFNLGGKAGDLLTALLSLISNLETGGFGGFISRFQNAGLGDLVNSWITSGDNTPISNEQIESALGENTINSIAEQTAIDRAKTTSALALMTPHVVDALTPDGDIPDEASLLSRIGGFLPAPAAAIASENIIAKQLGTADTISAGERRIAQNFDKIDAGAVAAAEPDALNNFDGDNDNNPILKWLLPLILLGLVIVLGYSFCGKSVEPTKPNNANVVNTNSSK